MLRANFIEKALQEYGTSSLVDIVQSYNCWVAGGFWRAKINSFETGSTDCDIFFASKEEALAAVWDYVSKYSLKDRTPISIRMSKSAVTITLFDDIQIQFIYAFVFDNVKELLDHFDFTVSQIAVWYHGEWKEQRAESFDNDLQKLRLVYTGSTCPLSSLWRSYKYRDKGYKLTQQELAKILSEVYTEGEKNQTNPEDETERPMLEVFQEMFKEYID